MSSSWSARSAFSASGRDLGEGVVGRSEDRERTLALERGREPGGVQRREQRVEGAGLRGHLDDVRLRDDLNRVVVARGRGQHGDCHSSRAGRLGEQHWGSPRCAGTGCVYKKYLIKLRQAYNTPRTRSRVANRPPWGPSMMWASRSSRRKKSTGRFWRGPRGASCTARATWCVSSLSDGGNGRIRVDANAETVSDDSLVDFGRAHGIVRDYLSALDERLSGRADGCR